MNITRRLDWITYTHHDIGAWQRWLPVWKYGDQIGKQIKPLPRYDKAWEILPAGRVDISSDEHQGVVVNISGSELTEWIANGVSFQSIIASAVEKGKVTRLDFATDCREDGTSDMSLWEKIEIAANTGNYRSRLRAGVQIHDIEKGGFTQYFGAYKSDRFIRCYDKATESGLLKQAMKEAGILPVWTRVEMVNKRDFAHNLAMDMHYHGWQQAGASALRKVIDFPDIDGWGQLTDGYSVELSEVGRKQGKWHEWLQNQVLPSIINHSKNEADRKFLLRWLQQVVEHVWDADVVQS